MAHGKHRIDVHPGVSARPIDRLLGPLDRFLRLEAAGGILLLVCTVIALIWANSGLRDSYAALWATRVVAGFGAIVIDKPLILWVNDGLMAIFFFVVGLEIKRELVAGELASPRKAAMPIVAAVGGMLVPALVYAGLNLGQESIRGWAIPAATDIAFAIGILALLGDRVPLGLKVFLTALAIVDDIGAVLVIAFFYTESLNTTALLTAGGALVVCIAMNLLHVRRAWPFALVGAILWVAMLKSGVHATVAGVLLAFTIPATVRIEAPKFVEAMKGLVARFDGARGGGDAILRNAERQAVVQAIEKACEHVETPLSRLEHALVPVSSFVIMPIFALANAGVTIHGGIGAAFADRITLGVALGLVVGKQIGVTFFTWLAVKLGLGALPERTNWLQIYGASWLAGIGFTMSLFIAGLAFGGGHGGDAGHASVALEHAKVGILAGSLVAGVVGFVLLRRRT